MTKPVDPNDVLAKAEDIHDRSIQDQALEAVPDAMKALKKFSRGHKINGVKPTAQVIRSSARDIIEFAGGRPETRDPSVGSGEGSQIFIIRTFSDGTSKQISGDSPIDVEFEKLDPIQEAERSKKSVARSFQIPDAPAIPEEDS